MERYLEGAGARRRGGRARAQGRGHARRDLPGRLRRRDEEPRHDALLDLLVEGVPSPAKKGAPDGHRRGAGTAAFIFKTVADPFAGRINVFRVFSGTLKSDSSRRRRARRTTKERIGQLLTLQGKEHAPVGRVRRGRHRRRREAEGREDRRPAARRRARPSSSPPIPFPEPVMSFAITPKSKGEEEKVGDRRCAASPRRIRRCSLRRDPQTGEQLLSGMSQVHVEVAVERAEAAASASRSSCTSRACRTSRRSARSRAPRASTRSRPAAAASTATATSCSSRSRGAPATSSSTRSSAASIPQSFRPAVDKGIQEAMLHGELAGAPVQGVRATARRRLVPQRRLLGDGVQDRRLDGVQARVREGRPGAARADHGRRGDRPGRRPWAPSTATSTRGAAGSRAWSPRAG